MRHLLPRMQRQIGNYTCHRNAKLI
eukprot:SAG25_NODE_6286_length_572_cov_0.930233_1_plen_24_part_01